VTQEDLVDRIYEAAVVAEGWRSVLVDVAALSSTRGAVVVTSGGEEPRYLTSSPSFDEFVSEYISAYPLAQSARTQRLLAGGHPGFLTDQDVFDADEIAREPLYRDFLIPRGYGVGAATVIRAPNGDAIIVHCEGSAADGPIRRESVAALDALRPHLARAALLSARLELDRARSAAAALEAVGLPAAVLGRGARALAANEGFERLTAQIDIAAGDAITLKDRAAGRLLADALARASAHHAHGGSIPLPAAGDQPPAVLHLLPLRRAAAEVFAQASSILVVTPLGRQAAPTATILAGLFDLTPAEARVAKELVAGRTVTEIADSNGLADSTVRNQLRAVFAKTGATRQAELVLLCGGMGLGSASV
jgi:DNA-binding CsgD family transcriptional regulator